MAKANEVNTSGGDRHIIMRKVFAAPPSMVWKAWTDPEHLSQWWGPDGFTTTTHSMDLKPGGQWLFTMHGPDGVDFPNRVVFNEIKPGEKLTYTHDNGDNPEMEVIAFQVTVLFEAQGSDRTRLTLSTEFPTTEARDHVSETYGAVQGGIDTVTRLAAYLSQNTGPVPQSLAVALPDDKTIIMTWLMDATPEQIFHAYSSAEQLRQWWGCASFEVTTCEVDFREGGNWRVVQKTPDGQVHPFKGEYLKINRPFHITHTFIYDVEGIRDYPSVESLDLTPKNGQTVLTMTVTHQSKEARDGHLNSGMTDGVTTSMNRLAELVAIH